VLADALLLVHFALALFIVLGLPLVVLGARAGWSWVRHRSLRVAHFAAIGCVALEGVLGIACPLTVWEDALRGETQATGFVARWVRRWLYYDVPPEVFAFVYCVYAALTAAAWHWVPPRPVRDAAAPDQARASAQMLRAQPQA